MKRLGVRIPVRTEVCVESHAQPVPPSQLSYDEYIDYALSVGKYDGGD